MNRRYMLNVSAVTVLGLALLAGGAAEAAKAKFNKKQLVGGWELVTAGAPNPDIQSFGPGDGYAVFQPNGHFSLQLVLPNLPKFASNNRAKGTPDENKAVVQGSIAYFGTYSLDGSDGTLTLHIERCTFANWDGTDLKRPIISLTADELKYTNPAASVGGATELVWKRVK
jgi:ABC-type transport system substrate-binding protein